MEAPPQKLGTRVVALPKLFDCAALNWSSFPGTQDRDWIEAPPLTEEARSYLDSLPAGPGRATVGRVVRLMQKAHGEGRAIVWAAGASALRAGAAPILVEFIKRGIVSCLCLDGDAARYDVENALFGQGLKPWQQNGSAAGLWEETGGVWIEALRRGRGRRIGIGWALGDVLLGQRSDFVTESLLVTCVERRVPASVHLAGGCLGLELHPEFSGGDLGEAGLIDFRAFCQVALKLDRGLWLQTADFMPLGRLLCRAIALLENLGMASENITGVFLGPEPRYAVTDEVRALFSERGSGSRQLELLPGSLDLILPLLRAAATNPGGASPAGGTSPAGAAAPPRDQYRDL